MFLLEPTYDALFGVVRSFSSAVSNDCSRDDSSENHFLPQYLGCFIDVVLAVWTVVTAISDLNALCSLRHVVERCKPVKHSR